MLWCGVAWYVFVPSRKPIKKRSRSVWQGCVCVRAATVMSKIGSCFLKPVMKHGYRLLSLKRFCVRCRNVCQEKKFFDISFS